MKKYLNFPGANFSSEIWSMTLSISLTLFTLHYKFSFPHRHQNCINFEFLHKHRYLYLSLFLSCRNMELVSFYGNKLWLRDGKNIFAISQSVVYHGFICRFPSPIVIMANTKYSFSDIFSHGLLKLIFFWTWDKEFFTLSNEVETSWFFLDVCKLWLHLLPPIIHSHVCILLLFQFWDENNKEQNTAK